MVHKLQCYHIEQSLSFWVIDMWIVRKQIDTAKRLDDTRPRKRHTDCWHKGHSVGATRLNMDHGGTVVPFLGNARNAREAVAVASNASVSDSGRSFGERDLLVTAWRNNCQDTEKNYLNTSTEIGFPPPGITPSFRNSVGDARENGNNGPLFRLSESRFDLLLKINYPRCSAFDICLFHTVITIVFFFIR